MIGYSSTRLLRSGLISFRIEGRSLTSKRVRDCRPVQTDIMSHTQTITLSYSPQATTVHLLSQRGDGLSTTENKNKTTNIWLFSLGTVLSDRASGLTKLMKIRKEKKKLGDPCTVNGSVSAGFQSAPGNFTDNITSYRAERLFTEIPSCSFCLEWQLADSHCSMAQGCSSLTYFDGIFGSRHSVPALALGCGLLSTFTHSYFLFFFFKKEELISFRHLHSYPHYMEDPLCVLPQQQGTDRKKSRDWTEINNSLTPNWSWAAHLWGHFIINIST